jgi:hypothetical protein
MRIEQTLHGYSDGHRLLAASKELSRGAKYVMLPLSDMSGRSMVPNFEEYLTGYPVPETSLYAFARTWYAPEMERPGCVWTHTLLVESKDLGNISDFAALLPLFRRPTRRGTKDSWEEFRSALELPEPQGHQADLPRALDQVAKSLLLALYRTPDAPVVLAAEDSTSFEMLLLALWSQQWPALIHAPGGSVWLEAGNC